MKRPGLIRIILLALLVCASQAYGQQTKQQAYYAEKISKIILPTLDLTNASLEQALEHLREKSVELDTFTTDPALRGVKFVIRPGLPQPEARVTLSLRKVPMKEALRYITELMAAGYQVEPDGVVITTLAEANAAAAAKAEAVTKQRMDKRLSFILQGYELAKKDAALLLQGTEANLNAKNVLRQASILTSQGKGRIVKFPQVTAKSGERGLGKDKELQVELEAILGPDMETVDVMMAIQQGSGRLNTGVSISLGGFCLIGSLEGRARNSVELVFMTVKPE